MQQFLRCIFSGDRDDIPGVEEQEDTEDEGEESELFRDVLEREKASEEPEDEEEEDDEADEEGEASERQRKIDTLLAHESVGHGNLRLARLELGTGFVL